MSAAPGRRLYIGRLHPDANRLDVEDLFNSVAKTVEVKIFSGFGFIEYDSIDDAEDAIKKLDGTDFMGDRIIVQFAKSAGRDRERRDAPRYDRGDRGSGGRPEQGWRLVMSNLPPGCSWQDLKDFARTAGNVHYSEVSRSDPSEGLVEYMSHSDAEEAIKKLDGVDMRGSIVRVAEGQAPPGQTWSNPRPSPPRAARDDRDRGYSRRDRSRSPGYRRDDRDRDRGGDRDRYNDRRRDERDGGRDRDDRDRRGGDRDRDVDRRDRGGDRDRYDDRRRSPPRRERSPPKYD